MAVARRREMERKRKASRLLHRGTSSHKAGEMGLQKKRERSPKYQESILSFWPVLGKGIKRENVELLSHSSEKWEGHR